LASIHSYCRQPGELFQPRPRARSLPPGQSI
jgi:hypothetical protein